MNIDPSGLWWLGAAAALALGELLIPGVFLIFLALAAAITGVATVVLADLPLVAQIGAFAVWAAVCVLLGHRWYRDYPVNSNDPLLNDRLARLIGQTVLVVEPIAGGRGRVRVGDGEWPATGPDLPAGAQARVVGATGTVLAVAPLSG